MRDYGSQVLILANTSAMVIVLCTFVLKVCDGMNWPLSYVYQRFFFVRVVLNNKARHGILVK